MWLAVVVGGGMGALARYGLGGWIQGSAGAGFPWGTLVINVTGSLLLALTYAVLEGVRARPEWRALIGIGFCGGYTTFSTFSYEAFRLLQDGEWNRALAYMLGSLLLALAGTVAGFYLGETVLRVRG